jgi:guanosine-3',5'-bis(diphosphate) 3'-pyrophosphohydrolase
MDEFLSEKVLNALEFAAVAHQAQKRKDGVTPYIGHPASVGIILAQAGFSEDVVIAGILHDVIEDTKFSYGDIVEQFGKPVADLVQTVTLDAALPHDEQREKYRQSIDAAGVESCAISAADLLSNRRSMIRDLRRGVDVWSWYKRGKDGLIELDSNRLSVIKKHLKDHPLMQQLESAESELINFS